MRGLRQRSSGTRPLPASEAVRTVADARTRELAARYVAYFELEHEPLHLTTDRREFQRWLGRRVDSAIGGAYVWLPRPGCHLILINLERIDLTQPRALEIVVAEEFLHLRNWLDGDRRRHARHGHDRVALWVAGLTGASLDEVRGCLRPRHPAPARYVYRCPGCAREVRRRRRGTWSCARCSPRFDPRYVLTLERDLREG